MPSIALGVNIDHIATLRQSRGTDYPRPIDGARICQECNVDGVTVHLREDRRHIQEHDVYEIKKNIQCKLNLEMALARDVIAIAKDVKPFMVTLVPEKREELTTEGGLDVRNHFQEIVSLVKEFTSLGIIVSLFIEPDKDIIQLSKETGAAFIEIHTGTYANAHNEEAIKRELTKIYSASEYAKEIGLRVNAGHGLNYDNLKPILQMEGLEELNIGHAIIARAVLVGLRQAIIDMQNLLKM
jgi:pyridoxine 5-phosphate synthase